MSILSGGGASAVTEPGHFEVRKFSSQVTRMHFFPQKSWWRFLFVTLKTQAAKNKRHKSVRYGNIFIFCSHYYRSKAIRTARQGLSQGDGSAARSFDLGAPWCTEHNTHVPSFPSGFLVRRHGSGAPPGGLIIPTMFARSMSWPPSV